MDLHELKKIMSYLRSKLLFTIINKTLALIENSRVDEIYLLKIKTEVF